MDEIRLKRLMQENFLRVEEENYYAVSKELQEENFKKSERILKETQDIVDSVASENQRRAKNVAIKRKVKPLKPTFTIEPEVEPTKQSTCSDGHFEMDHMHFLNHYQSQLQQQQWELQKKRSVYAVPLSLPCQRDVYFTRQELQRSHKKQTNKENNHLYHFVHNEGAKNLTIQKLPSINVYNKNCRVNSNVSLEEIKEYDEDSGYNTKTFPDDYTKISPPVHKNRNASECSPSERNKNQRVHQPERSVFRENINGSQTHIDKNLLKALMKEILEDSENSSNCQLNLDSSKENGCSSKLRSFQSSNCELIEKKEQKCNCHMYARNTLHTQTEEAAIHSTFSQTETASPDKLKMDNRSLRNLIQEVISECRVLPPAVPDVKGINRELNSPVNPQKEEKVVQASIPILEKSSDLYYLSKETQVSMHEENDCPQSNIQMLKLNYSGCQKISEEQSENKSSNSNIEQQLVAVTLKVENLMNVFNNHVMKKSELFAENVPQNNSSNKERPIHTRDVSLQFSPYLINKSACTSPVRTLEKANQCNNYPDSNQTKKQYFDVCTQVAASLSDTKIEKSATVATQADYQVANTIDTWVQTEEVNTNVEVLEHSNNGSVSITPVSDSPFLDDVLSEGEIPLHLRFLSYHDHASNPNSTVAESSEEKDYSLSEGEVHPRYLQSSSFDYTASTDISKGAQFCSSCTSLKQAKLYNEKNWNAYPDCSVGEVSSFLQDQNARQINSSTPVQNKSPSNHRNSSGEIPFHWFPSNKKPSSHDNKRREMTINSITEKDSNNYYSNKTGYQMPDKILSPSNLSSLSSLDNSN